MKGVDGQKGEKGPQGRRGEKGDYGPPGMQVSVSHLQQKCHCAMPLSHRDSLVQRVAKVLLVPLVQK